MTALEAFGALQRGLDDPSGYITHLPDALAIRGENVVAPAAGSRSGHTIAEADQGALRIGRVGGEDRFLATAPIKGGDFINTFAI